MFTLDVTISHPISPHETQGKRSQRTSPVLKRQKIPAPFRSMNNLLFGDFCKLWVYQRVISVDHLWRAKNSSITLPSERSSGRFRARPGGRLSGSPWRLVFTMRRSRELRKTKKHSGCSAKIDKNRGAGDWYAIGIIINLLWLWL